MRSASVLPCKQRKKCPFDEKGNGQLFDWKFCVRPLCVCSCSCRKEDEKTSGREKTSCPDVFFTRNFIDSRVKIWWLDGNSGRDAPENATAEIQIVKYFFHLIFNQIPSYANVPQYFFFSMDRSIISSYYVSFRVISIFGQFFIRAILKEEFFSHPSGIHYRFIRGWGYGCVWKWVSIALHFIWFA